MQVVVGVGVLAAVSGLTVALVRGRSQLELPALTTYAVPALPALTASAARPSTQSITVREVLRFEDGNWMATATTGTGTRVLLASATPLAAGSTYEALPVDQVFVTTATPLRFATVSSLRGQTVSGDLQALMVLRVAPAYRPPERVVEAVVIAPAAPATPAADTELSYTEREQIRQQRVSDFQKAETERKRRAQEAEEARINALIVQQGHELADALPDLTDRLTQAMQADGKVLDAMAVPRTFAKAQAHLSREVASIEGFWEDNAAEQAKAQERKDYPQFEEARKAFAALVAASQAKMQKWEAWAAKATSPEEQRRVDRERRADLAALQRRRELDSRRRQDLDALDRRSYGNPKDSSSTTKQRQVRLGERYVYDRRTHQWVVATDD